MQSSDTQKPRAHCGALTRSGAPCRHPRGFRTDHPGEGRCWLHGGASPIKHGRYSQIRRSQIRDLIERYEADPDPLNLTSELATVRALLADYLTRTPVKQVEHDVAARLVTDIAKVVARIEKIRAQNAVSRPELYRILRELGAIVRRHNDEPDPDRRLELIRRDWERIAI